MNYLPWLTMQCRMLPAVQRALVATAADSSQQLTASAVWPHEHVVCEDLLTAATLAHGRQAPVVSVAEGAAGQQMMVLARPLANSSGHPTVLVVELPASNEQRAVLLQLLEWGESWLQLMAQLPAVATAAVAVTESDYAVLQAACSVKSLAAAVAAVATSLAQLFNCEQAAIGLSKGSDIALSGLAHNTAFDAKTNKARAMEELMAECAEHRLAIQAPSPAGQSYPSHQQYAQQHELCIYSQPLCAREELQGVLLLQRRQLAFSPQEQQRLSLLAEFLAALFEARAESERSLTRQLRETAKQTWQHYVGASSGRYKYLLALPLVALMLLVMGSGQYRVAAAAKLEGLIQRAVVAPIDGYVLQAHARAGETVRIGQVIAELDDRELQLEYRRLQNQRDEYRQQYRKELADRNLAQSQIAQAQVAQTEAEIRLLQEQLKRTQLTVPFNGVIIEGDLSRSLGAPVSKGQVLFEIAPLDEYRLVLNIDERDVPHLKVGQLGSLYLNSYPAQAIRFQIKQVATVYEREGAAISYRTEASLLDSELLLRPGMQGLAKVEVGERRYLWMLFHPMLDWLRLKWWSWLP